MTGPFPKPQVMEVEWARQIWMRDAGGVDWLVHLWWGDPLRLRVQCSTTKVGGFAFVAQHWSGGGA